MWVLGHLVSIYFEQKFKHDKWISLPWRPFDSVQSTNSTSTCLHHISQWSSYEVKTRLFASVNTSLLHLSPLLVSLLHLSPVSLVIIVSSLWLKLSLRCWSWLGSPISTFNPSLIGSKLWYQHSGSSAVTWQPGWQPTFNFNCQYLRSLQGLQFLWA